MNGWQPIDQTAAAAPSPPYPPPGAAPGVFPPPPPAGYWPPPVQGPYGYGYAPVQRGNGKSIAAIVLGVVAIFVCPPLFGSLGIWLARKAQDEGEPKAKAAKTVAITGLVVGLVFGFLWVVLSSSISGGS